MIHGNCNLSILHPYESDLATTVSLSLERLQKKRVSASTLEINTPSIFLSLYSMQMLVKLTITEKLSPCMQYRVCKCVYCPLELQSQCNNNYVSMLLVLVQPCNVSVIYCAYYKAQKMHRTDKQHKETRDSFSLRPKTSRYAKVGRIFFGKKK